MSEKISTYVKNCKPWFIKNALTQYLNAVNLNADIYQEYHTDGEVKFDKLKELSAILFRAKENLHLVYRRLLDPKNNIFEDAYKYTPNEVEMDFINNIGILFHKAMVTRELVYMLEYYETESDEDYLDVKQSLDTYVERIKTLFDKGINYVLPFIKYFVNNPLILSYFLENEEYVEATLGENIVSFFSELEGENSIDNAYVSVGNYFLQSGWQERAKTILYNALEANPRNSEAQKLLEKCD